MSLYSHYFLLVFFPPALFFLPVVHGLQYITFPLPHYLNTLTGNIGTCCFLPQSNILMTFWRIFLIEKAELDVQ